MVKLEWYYELTILAPLILSNDPVMRVGTGNN
jgi:hypothetical protein